MPPQSKPRADWRRFLALIGVPGWRLKLSMNRKGDIPVARSDMKATGMSPFR